MKINNLNSNAFTLLEVLLASVIFIISVAGIFATLNAVRGPVANKENQLAAAVFGKQVLEALYSQVTDASYYNACSMTGAGTSASPCQGFDLSLGFHQVTLPPANAPNIDWPSNNILKNANFIAGNPYLLFSQRR